MQLKIAKIVSVIALSVAYCTSAFATVTINNSEMTQAEYQAQADKYKELYEKYQKLANSTPTSQKTAEATQSGETAVKTASTAKPVSTTDEPSKNTTDKKESPTPAKEPQKTSDTVASKWKGTNFGFGGTIATGDSATTNVNVLSNVNYKPMEEWNNKLFFNYVYSRDDRVGKRSVKINKSQIRGETSWDFTPKNGVYGRITYLNDELSTYDYIMTQSIGYKRMLFETKTMNLSVTGGPSYMQSKLNSGDRIPNQIGFQSTANYVWNFTGKSNFKQNFLYNYDQKNKSIYQTISALSVELFQDFSLQLTFQLDGTTVVAPGKQNINTITSTNIMYTL